MSGRCRYCEKEFRNLRLHQCKKKDERDKARNEARKRILEEAQSFAIFRTAINPYNRFGEGYGKLPADARAIVDDFYGSLQDDFNMAFDEIVADAVLAKMIKDKVGNGWDVGELNESVDVSYQILMDRLARKRRDVIDDIVALAGRRNCKVVVKNTPMEVGAALACEANNDHPLLRGWHPVPASMFFNTYDIPAEVGNKIIPSILCDMARAAKGANLQFAAIGNDVCPREQLQKK